jgi:hypothetical protein
LVKSLFEVFNVPLYIFQPTLQEKVGEEPNCFLCQIVVVSVEMAIIGDNVTMDHIVESVGYVCDTLGAEDSNIVSSCHDLVEEYLETIIDMIVVQFFQPFDVCTTLNMCP